jgi:hypothetical protein
VRAPPPTGSPAGLITPPVRQSGPLLPCSHTMPTAMPTAQIGLDRPVNEKTCKIVGVAGDRQMDRAMRTARCRRGVALSIWETRSAHDASFIRYHSPFGVGFTRPHHPPAKQAGYTA